MTYKSESKPLPPRTRKKGGPHLDDWSADRSRGGALKWIGVIVAAIVVVGGLIGLMGQFDRANRPTPTAQAPASPAPAPATTGQAPAR